MHPHICTRGACSVGGACMCLCGEVVQLGHKTGTPGCFVPIHKLQEFSVKVVTIV
jgi:hypothetical protein